MATTTINYDSITDSNTLVITLASLPTSASSVTGRESTAISNTTTKYMDVLVSGQIRTGSATLTAGTIEIWVYAQLKVASSTPTYPSPLTGSDAGVTFVAETKNKLLLGDAIATNTTADTKYAIRPFSLTSLFGVVPERWGVVVIHNTGQNLNATAGDQFIHYTGIKFDSA
jgi:hypothetical protein